MFVTRDTSYEELHSHVTELVKICSDHQWVYDIQMTKFFAKSWWEKIPAEWVDTLLRLRNEELNQMPLGFFKDSWPSSLQHFIVQCQQLSLSRIPPPAIADQAVVISNEVKQLGGVSPKKLHEVSQLAGVVRDVCKDNCCSLVLDIGSGLGYLGSCLSRQCALTVVGLERERTRVDTANKRGGVHHEPCDSISTDSHVMHEWTSELKRLLPSDFSTPQMISVGLNVDHTPLTASKLTSLLTMLQDLHSSPLRVCVVGLHCCGPLSPSILKLLTEHLHHPSLRVLLLLGCCYHKTEHTQWSPLSYALTELLSTRRHSFNLGTFGLRLAAQETRDRWCKQTDESHDNHMRRVAYRAMAEVVCAEDSLSGNVLRRLKVTSIEEYAIGVASCLHADELRGKLITYHNQNEHHMRLVEPFTALQVCLQGVMESVVLLDWLMYLRERGVANCTLTPVFDPAISPRNVMLHCQLTCDRSHDGSHD